MKQLYKNVIRAIAIGALCLSGMLAIADDYPTHMVFRNVMEDVEVSLGEVISIVQDAEGFIWLGGRNGLLRFDGYEFLEVPIRMDPADPGKDQPASHVDELFVDSRQNLWIATHSGVFLLDRSENILRPLQSPNPQIHKSFSLNTSLVAETKSGQILLGGDLGLAILDPATLDGVLLDKVNGSDNQLVGRNVYDAVLDKQGNVWLGTETGLSRLDWASQTFTYYIPFPEKPESGADNSVKVVEYDKRGFIWAGTENGLYSFNPDTASFKSYKHDPNDPYSITDNAARALFTDSKDRLWYGSRTGGLNIYDPVKDHFVRVEHHEGEAGNLFTNSVVCIYEDHNGDFWVGTYPSGANFHDRSSSAFSVYQEARVTGMGLLASDVGAIAEDAKGNLWVGAGGVTKINLKAGTFEHYHPDPNTLAGGAKYIASTAMLAALVDSDGDIWFGTWADGLQRYDHEREQFLAQPYDISLSRAGSVTGNVVNDNVIWSLYEDSQGTIWMGTHNGGLNRYDKASGRYTYYRFNVDDVTSLSNQIVWSVMEDSQKRFWVGTSDGLNLMDRASGTFKRYHATDNRPGSLNNDSVLSIYEDKKNRLWFGTDIGLHLYNEEKDNFKVYTTRDGLADNGIRSITEDAFGNLWISTNNGISRFNPDTGSIKNFQAFNRKKIGVFDTGSGLTMSTGEVVFGGENGLRIFNPKELDSHEGGKLPVVLTDFTLFTRSVPVNGPENILDRVINHADKVVLDYDKSMFSFKFAALNYRDPEKNRYAYQLVGFDDVWREVGNQRTATYTNMAPGTYYFNVKATTGSGEWSVKESPLKIIIEPPPWRTWWAYCGYALLILLAFYFRAEHRRLRESAETYKTQSVTDALTHIYNRAGIDQVTTKLFADLEKSKDTAVMVLDIDHFKRVNDNWGHDAGDYILTNIANTIVQNVRRTDFVGRWGGEELVLICPSTTQSAATLIAEKLRGTIAKNVFEINAKKIPVTVSIGVAIAKAGETFEAVFKRADIALYRAKSEGRNCVILSEENETVSF